MKPIKLILPTLLLIVGLNACKEPEARKPISQSEVNEINLSIERNKSLIQNEEELFKSYMSRDTIQEYITSSHGFWYSYTTRHLQDPTSPKPGDLVTFEYSVSDLNGNTIYAKEEIGTKQYRVDQEDHLQGIRHAIKLLKTNETATFLFPSHLIYGYAGDNNKIKKNEPLVISLTIKSIERK